MSSESSISIDSIPTRARDGSRGARTRLPCDRERPRPWAKAPPIVGRCFPHFAMALLVAACGSPSEPEPPAVDEREVLTLLYENTGGSLWWVQDGWLSDGELGTWHGVETNSAGQVVGIELILNNLIGTIPPELGQLVHLEYLRFRGNGLSGPIPPELGNLTNLGTLNLRQNRLSGPIPPELGKLENLDTLSLYVNQLNGRIPVGLFELDQLELLILGYNELSGPIPPELGSMRSLKRVWLDFNNLSGQVPPELGDLGTRVDWLDFQQNDELSGPLPHALTNLTNLIRFEWAYTGLCSPPDSEFQEWLESVPNAYGHGPVCP